MKTILFLFSSVLFAHEIDEGMPKWKHYYRCGLIQSEDNARGMGGYFRIKRNTNYTFKDLRLFAHYISSSDSYVKLRYKNSTKFVKFSQFYNFTVVSFDQNKKVGLNIRSQGSQGAGVFLLDYAFGHINTELSYSYDMMDHLNDTRKSSYLKGGIFWDNELPFIESKLEIEYIYQISDSEQQNDLSRTEVLFEVFFPVTSNLNIIGGYEREEFWHQDAGYSLFVSLGYNTPLNWKF